MSGLYPCARELPEAPLHTLVCKSVGFSVSPCKKGVAFRENDLRILQILRKKESGMPKAKILKFDAAGPGLTKSEILKVCNAENVRFLRLQFTDIFGVIKNVEIPKSQFEKALDG